MVNNKIRTLRKNIELSSNPGNEDKIRDFLIKEVKNNDANFNYEIDNLGSLIFTYGNNNNKKRTISIDAHIDTVGMIVTGINKKGFIEFEGKGGILKKWTIGHKVYFIHKGKPIYGVVMAIPPHLVNSVKKDDLFLIDFGFESKENAKKNGINIGSDIYWDNSSWENNNRIFGNGLDNLIGVSILLELMKDESAKKNFHNINFCFSVQEEVGLRGAKTLSQNLDSDIVLVLDTSPSPDIVDETDLLGSLDGGPFIRYMDRGYITPKTIVDFILEVAKDNGIKTQPYISLGGTNAHEWSLQGSGSKVVQLGCLARNIHSSYSVASISDINQTYSLLKNIILNFHKARF